jgi:hypothetical protein
MRKSRFLVVAFSLLAGYVLAITLNRPTAGQAPALEALPASHPAAVWRFHTTVMNTGGSYPILILTDTTNGHCWILECGPQEEEGWRDLGTPGSPRR